MIGARYAPSVWKGSLFSIVIVSAFISFFQLLTYCAYAFLSSLMLLRVE